MTNFVVTLTESIHDDGTPEFRVRIVPLGPILEKGVPTVITEADLGQLEEQNKEHHFLKYTVRPAQPDELPIPPRVYTPIPTDQLDVTAVVPSYRYERLIRRLVERFKLFYPQVPMIIVEDTGQWGPDPATDYIRGLPATWPDITPVIHEKNITHGPSLDEGFRLVKTRYVLSLDSDTLIQEGGFLEPMQARAMEAHLFAIGHYEFTVPNGQIHGVAALWDVAMYKTLPPFIKSGAPAEKLFAEVHRLGVAVEDFPIWDYIHHCGGGSTRDANRYWDPSAPEVQGWYEESWRKQREGQ